MKIEVWGFDADLADWTFLFLLYVEIVFTVYTLLVSGVILSVAAFANYWGRRFLFDFFWDLDQWNLTYLTVSHKFWILECAGRTQILSWFDRNRRFFLDLATVGTGVDVFPDFTLANITDPSIVDVHFRYDDLFDYSLTKIILFYWIKLWKNNR